MGFRQIVVFPKAQGDSSDPELRGRFMVKNRKSLSKVKKTRDLTEKGSKTRLQKLCVCAYIGHNVTLTAVRTILGVKYHCFWGAQKGPKWGFL